MVNVILTGDIVSKDLNEFFAAHPEKKEEFLKNLFEFEYTDDMGVAHKGLGLSATSNELGGIFYKDDDPDEIDKEDWDYNNRELPVDDSNFSTSDTFNKWLRTFDFPEYIHYYNEATGLFECYDRDDEYKAVYNKLFKI